MSDILGLTPRGDRQQSARASAEPARDALRIFTPEGETAPPEPEPIQAPEPVANPVPVGEASFRQEAPIHDLPLQPPPPIDAGDQQIRLDQVLARLGHVEWPEAVAIIEAACTALRAMGNEKTAPEMGGLAITPAGTVRVLVHASGASGPALARVLHALIAGRPLPVQLRLFVSKWVSSTEPHSTTEFSTELNYFVRPNGAALVAAVYQRAYAIAPVKQAAKATSVEAEPKTAKPQGERTPQPRWHASAAMIAMAAAGVLCLVLWGDAGSSQQASSASLSTASSTGSSAATGGGAGATSWISGSLQGIQSAFASLGQWVGLGGASNDSPAAPATSAQVAEVPAPPVAAPATPPARPVASPAAATRRAAAASPAPAPVAPSPSAPDASPAAVQPAPIVDASVPDSPAPQSELDDISKIYSVADADVRPPFLVSPKLPRPLVSGTNPSINMMELIISEAGTVQQVRLLSPPRRMADMMLLSGAKAWLFEPASRAGESVKYRLLLTWDTTP